jgi:SAM-dependent methyltransferase
VTPPLAFQTRMQPTDQTFHVRADLAKLYAGFYEGTSEWRELGAVDKAANVLRLSQGVDVRTVLDIGAGEGAVLELLARAGLGTEHHALEISPSGVAAIESRKIPSLQRCSLYDGYHIPYEDDRFDLAILSHVVEHAEYPRRLLYEAGRVARHVFVEVPLEENTRAPADYREDGVGHINHYSHRTIRKLLQSSGFTVLGEHHATTDYALLRYKYGWRAVFKYGPKAVLLRLFPRWALDRYTYVGAMLCRSPRPDAAAPPP